MAEKKKLGLLSKMPFKKAVKLLTTIGISVLIIVVGLAAMIYFRVQTGFWFWETDFLQYENHNGGIDYYPADYEENIFENPRYMELIRDIYFGEEEAYYLLSGDDYESAGEDAVFFRDYFDAIIKGDHETYNSFFMDGYFTSKVRPKGEFTMQKIYNIHVMKKGTEEVEMDGETYTANTYVVQYMIKQNNGTFRLGLPSDSYKPELYRIVDVDGEYKIHSILDIVTVYN